MSHVHRLPLLTHTYALDKPVAYICTQWEPMSSIINTKKTAAPAWSLTTARPCARTPSSMAVEMLRGGRGRERAYKRGAPRTASPVRDHVERRAKLARLPERTRREAIDGVERVARKVQPEEGR